MSYLFMPQNTAPTSLNPFQLSVFRRFFIFPALSLCLFAAGGQSSVYATEGSWEPTLEGEFRGDISTWAREVPGFDLKAFRGRVDMPYTALEVLAVLADFDNFPKWVFQCDDAQHVRELGNDVVYIHIKGIWPVDDRDVVTRTRIIQDARTNKIVIHSRAANELLPPRENTVRMPALENLFILEPLTDGWTRVTFQTFADPGGEIPSWLANFVSTRAPLDTLSGMRERLSLKQYHINDYRELGFTLPGVETMDFSQKAPRGDKR